MPAGRQLNIRLSPAARDRLEALAFLRRMPAASLARDIVLEYLDLHSETPGLAGVLSGLAEHDAAAKREGNVTTLSRQRRHDAVTSPEASTERVADPADDRR